MYEKNEVLYVKVKWNQIMFKSIAVFILVSDILCKEVRYVSRSDTDTIVEFGQCDYITTHPNEGGCKCNGNYANVLNISQYRVECQSTSNLLRRTGKLVPLTLLT